MMNIQVGSTIPSLGKGAGNNPNNTEVIMLQPAVVDEHDHLVSPQSIPKRRRSRLSEEAELERRDRIALRMREKRANETEEQKIMRRMREADRMKRKRANESEDQKMKRRCEAALRARLRRANMSPEERDRDRKKAAERMRTRRKNESDEQKSSRRQKAAERMRKRRACETPEQRSARRLSIALRMKAKRRRKGDNGIEELQPLSPGSLSPTSRIIHVSSSGDYPPSPGSGYPPSPGSDYLSPSPGDSNDKLDLPRVDDSHLTHQGSHIVMGGNVGLVNLDPSLMQDTLELTPLGPLPLSIKASQDDLMEYVSVKEEGQAIGRSSPKHPASPASSQETLHTLTRLSMSAETPAVTISQHKAPHTTTAITQASAHHVHHTHHNPPPRVLQQHVGHGKQQPESKFVDQQGVKFSQVHQHHGMPEQRLQTSTH